MSPDGEKTNEQNEEILEELDASNNDEFLDEKLSVLSERYSYEQLSDLSARRLGALNSDDEGLSEEDFLHKDFERLRNRFPDNNNVPFLRRVTLGEDYRGLRPLTRDQQQRIQDCHRKCSRNLDRARQDALEREDLSGPVSRFAAWLVDMADAATPVFGSWK